MPFDLNQIPEFCALRELCESMVQQIKELQGQVQATAWVDEREAMKLTGLSRPTLWRERNKSTSLIRWKADHGVRYDRASLIAHNNSRAIGRGHCSRALA